MLFTDIVDSTRRAVALGDSRVAGACSMRTTRSCGPSWRRYGGREVNTTGDGFVAAFDSPTQAVRCARARSSRPRRAAGFAVRAGVHTGECERRGDDLAGLAVHIAAGSPRRPAPGEVLVSRTVRDLVAGSDLQFADRGRARA